MRNTKTMYSLKKTFTYVSLMLVLSFGVNVSAKPTYIHIEDTDLDMSGGITLTFDEVKVYADEGSPDSQYVLGSMYDHGNGVKKDQVKAVEWYRKAAKLGQIEAQSILAVKYENGEGVEKDSTRALKWRLKAAEQGHDASQSLLGSAYYYGIGVRQDHAKGIYWLKKSAEQDNKYAPFTLGAIYEQGDNVLQNKITAKEWYGKSCDNGYQEGCDKYRELNKK